MLSSRAGRVRAGHPAAGTHAFVGPAPRLRGHQTGSSGLTDRSFAEVTPHPAGGIQARDRVLTGEIVEAGVKGAWRGRALRWFAGGRRLALILALDGLLISTSLYTAYLLRFEGQIWPEHQQIFRRFLPLFLAIRLSLHLAFGLHRWSFRLSGFYEALRVVTATLS